MPPPFRALSPVEFAAEVAGFAWTRRIWRVDMHHTFHPAHADWRGLVSVDSMHRFHVSERCFDDIAQHVSIAPDGSIWTGRDWNVTPASVGFGLNAGVFMFETVGNFDAGGDRLEGAQLASVVAVIAHVQLHFRLPVHALLFHREVPVTTKTCPGTSVEKADILKLVQECRGAARSGSSEAFALKAF